VSGCRFTLCCTAPWVPSKLKILFLISISLLKAFRYYFSGLWVLLAGFGRLGKSVLLTCEFTPINYPYALRVLIIYDIDLLFALEDGSEFNTYFTMFCGLVLLNFIQNMVFRRTTYQSRVNYNRVRKSNRFLRHEGNFHFHRSVLYYQQPFTRRRSS
jgi:hypothetical protein